MGQLGFPGFAAGPVKSATFDARPAAEELGLEVARMIAALEARPDLHSVDLLGDVRGRETKRHLAVGRDFLNVLRAYQRAGDAWLGVPLVRQSLAGAAELLAWRVSKNGGTVAQGEP